MSAKIEWTDETWNPLRGCRRVSPGCLHCYAERQAARPILSGPGLPYEGLVQIGKQGPHWTGVTAGPDKLDVPLRWRKPRKVFVCSMSDLFFENHTDEDIHQVFLVMEAAPRHTFQVLTKRAERMARWFAEKAPQETWTRWPLPNVWIGVSVEDQQRAEERLPHLLRVPAVVRFVSYEPALGPVDFSTWLQIGKCKLCSGWGYPGSGPNPTRRCERMCRSAKTTDNPEWEDVGLHWLIVGGESGPGARPFDLAWARQTVAQCRAAGVPCFVKQMGARPIYEPMQDLLDAELVEHGSGLCALGLRDRKGGSMEEWPEDLRVREFPMVHP